MEEHAIDKLAASNPNFYFSLSDTEALAVALQKKGYDLPLVAVHCIYETWSEDVYYAGWLHISDFDETADAIIKWIQGRNNN